MQSLRSQATYSSALPAFASSNSSSHPFGGAGVPRGGKRGGASYASSIISQDIGADRDLGSTGGSVLGSSIAYSQSDRLHRNGRRGSFGSVAGASDLGSVGGLSSIIGGGVGNSSYGGGSGYDYKSQDDANELEMDDVKSQYAGTQSGVTVF